MSDVNAETYFEISQVIYGSWRVVDLEAGSGVETMFTEGGRLRFGGAVSEGREAIRDVYQRRAQRGPRTARHLVHNLVVGEADERVEADYVLTLYVSDGQPVLPSTPPVLVADVKDSLVYDDTVGRWLLESRELDTVFQLESAELAVSFASDGE